MFSSRRLQAMVLVLTVSVLTIGFMLTGDLVQEATASNSDECQDALDECSRAALDQVLICINAGYNTHKCMVARAEAASKCLQAVIICEN